MRLAIPLSESPRGQKLEDLGFTRREDSFRPIGLAGREQSGQASAKSSEWLRDARRDPGLHGLRAKFEKCLTQAVRAPISEAAWKSATANHRLQADIDHLVAEAGRGALSSAAVLFRE